jgi:tRNA A58 N-methylase Trm61
MAVDQLKVAFSIVHELSKGNKIKADDFGITDYEFGQILLDLRDNKGYIENVSANFYDGGKVVHIFLNSARVTLKGSEFLHDNSVLMKTYKGLKEFKGWIPFI